MPKKRSPAPPTSHPIAAYRRRGDTVLIELKLTSLSQLYNSLDPSPFFEKELDAQADDYILGAVRDIGADKQFKLLIELPAADLQRTDQAAVQQSIRSHFVYRLQTARRQRRLDFRRGRMTLIVGLAFLAACLMLRQVASAMLPLTTAGIVSESLLIVGWVAMWGPLDFFLYGWWTNLGTCRIMEQLSAVDVELCAN